MKRNRINYNDVTKLRGYVNGRYNSVESVCNTTISGALNDWSGTNGGTVSMTVCDSEGNHKWSGEYTLSGKRVY